MKLRAMSLIDFYKVGHVFQYLPGTTRVYSNFTPRADHHAPLIREFHDGKVLVVGIQATIKLLKEIWDEGFFNLPKEEVVEHYRRRITRALGPGQDVSHVEALHDLGYLPIEIRALPEGSRIPLKVPMFTITNTKDEFYWLPNFLEDMLSSLTWKMVTNATIAAHYRKIIEHYTAATGTLPMFVQWQGHDFSFRGMSTPWDAAINGFACLVSFSGTDNVASIDFAEDYYNANVDEELVGGSVPATEHSVMSSAILIMEQVFQEMETADENCSV